jgi:glucokinase
VDYLAKSEFRTQFEAKGRFKSYLASVPTAVITHPEPTFLGLERLAQQGQDGRYVT